MTGQTCGQKDALVSYLYDECDAAERARVDAHLATCAECRAEVAEFRKVRAQLAGWTPPDRALGFTIFNATPATAAPTRPTWRSARVWMPAGLAAAAVLLLASAAAIANLDVRYGKDGLVVRTGWNHDEVGQSGSRAVRQSGSRAVGQSDSRAVGQSGSPTVGQSGSRAVGQSESPTVGQSGSRAVGQSDSRAVAESDAPTVRPSNGPMVARPDNRTVAQSTIPAVTQADLVALERRLKTEWTSTSSRPVRVVSAADASDDELLQRMQSLISESEHRQNRELAVRVAQLVRDFDAQRQNDLVRIQNGIGALQGSTAADRQLLNYLVKVSRQQ